MYESGLQKRNCCYKNGWAGRRHNPRCSCGAVMKKPYQSTTMRRSDRLALTGGQERGFRTVVGFRGSWWEIDQALAVSPETSCCAAHIDIPYLLANARRLCFPEILSVLNFSSSLVESKHCPCWNNHHLQRAQLFTSRLSMGLRRPDGLRQKNGRVRQDPPV